MMEGKEMAGKVPREFQLPIAQGVADIWREIFDYLTDPRDFLNLLLASPDYFEALLENRKCALLFPLVLQVLDRRDYVAKSTTLECRLLSQFSNKAVDKWILDGNPCLENLDCWEHDKWDPKHDKLHCWSPHPCLSWENKVNNESSPFVGGYVGLDLPNDICEPQLLDNFLSLLGRFGSQIRRLKLSFGLEHWTLFECLVLLRECLELMPNLVALYIRDFADEEETSQDFLPSTLPNLSHLSTLRIEADDSVGLVNVLLAKYGAQIKKLCLFKLNVILEGSQQLQFGLVGNLKQVSLPPIFDVDEVSQRLDPTREWLPTLETLTVSICSHPIGPILTELVAAMAYNFGRSRKLQNLKLNLENPSPARVFERSEISPLRLILPSLKRLWIYCESCRMPSLDFILGMRETLEELTLDMCLSENCIPEETQLMRLVGRMQDSDLWNEMSKLDRITIPKKERGSPAQVYSFRRQCKLQMDGIENLEWLFSGIDS